MRTFLLWFRSIDVVLQIVGIICSVVFFLHEPTIHGCFKYFFWFLAPFDNGSVGKEISLVSIQLASVVIGVFVEYRLRIRSLTYLLAMGSLIIFGWLLFLFGLFALAFFIFSVSLFCHCCQGPGRSAQRTKYHMPVGIQAPAWLLEIAALIHGTETELLLKSRWVLPTKLLQAGFVFKYSKMEYALHNLLKSK